MRSRHRCIRYQRGFTLTELAIVLLIVALLIGGLLMPLSAQVDFRNAADTEKRLTEIRDALLGYAASHRATDSKPYLPCPDKTTSAGAGTAHDGQEDRDAGGTCAAPEGNLPWVTLGIGEYDSWGNRFRYAVHGGFSNSSAGFTLSSSPNLMVCADAACTQTLASGVPAVVLSHGKNGAGAINSGTNSANPGPAGADETENTDGDNRYVSHTPTPAGSANEFDDIVTWLSPNVLFNRMIAAGQLP